jgi:hypothetical protein
MREILATNQTSNSPPRFAPPAGHGTTNSRVWSDTGANLQAPTVRDTHSYSFVTTLHPLLAVPGLKYVTTEQPSP